MTDRTEGLDERVEADWAAFRRRLADRLAGLAADEMLLVEVETGVDDEELLGATPYLQFCGWGDDMLRAEAVSNVFLDPGFELDEEQQAALVAMGWCPEAYDADGDPVPGEENFSVDTTVDFADWVAVIAVGALREGYGCVHPSFLVADGLERAEHAAGSAGTPATESGEQTGSTGPFDGLDDTAVVPAGPDDLRQLVDDALAGMLEGPVTHDDDGDVGIVCGQSVVFVRVHADRPAIEIFAVLVVGLPGRDGVAEELDRLNRRDPDRQFFRRGDRVVARHVLVAWPFAAEQLRICVRIFGEDIDEVAEELAERLGGRRFLDPDVEEQPAPVQVGEVAREVAPALTGLVELMRLGHVPSAQVAALFGHDRDELVRALRAVQRGVLRDESAPSTEEEAVLDRLRRGLRAVVEREARRGPRDPRPRTHQPTLPGAEADDQDSLDGLWGKEVR